MASADSKFDHFLYFYFIIIIIIFFAVPSIQFE